MRLTDREQQEIYYLRELNGSRTIPMTQEQQDRLKYLAKKEVHNCCSNIHCDGYNGANHETECPKCGAELFKTLTPQNK